MSRFGNFDERKIERMIAGHLEGNIIPELDGPSDPDLPQRTFTWLKRLPIIAVFACFALFLLSIPVVYFKCLMGTPLEISGATTFITEPLNTDGTAVDYRKAIDETYFKPYFPQNGIIPKDANGFALLARELGNPGILGTVDLYGHEGAWEKICNRMEIDPGREPELEYVDIIEWLLRRKLLEVDVPVFDPFFYEEEFKTQAGKRLSNLTRGPWDGIKNPDILEWVEKYGPALDKVLEALESPVFLAPMIFDGPEARMEDRLRYDLPMYGSFATGLRVRAMLFFARGDFPNALKDVRGMLLISRFCSKVPEYAYLRYSFSLETTAIEIAINLLKLKKFTPETIGEFREFYSKLPERLTNEDYSRVQRYIALETLSALATGKAEMDDVDKRAAMYYPLYGPLYGIDWNAVAERYNMQWDKIAEFAAGETFKEKEKIGKELQERLLTRKKYGNFLNQLYEMSSVSKRSLQFGDVFLMATNPPMFESVRYSEGTALAQAFLETVIAVEFYYAENQVVPESLAILLEKEYLVRIPRDPCEPSRVIGYQPEANKKNYTLRSVGPDGIDDSMITGKNDDVVKKL